MVDLVQKAEVLRFLFIKQPPDLVNLLHLLLLLGIVRVVRLLLGQLLDHLVLLLDMVLHVLVIAFKGQFELA